MIIAAVASRTSSYQMAKAEGQRKGGCASVRRAKESTLAVKPTKSTAKPKTASHFAPSTPGESHSPSDESYKPRTPSKREHRLISMAGFDADKIDDGDYRPDD